MTTQTTTTPSVDDFDAVFEQITKLDEHGKEPDVAPAPVVASAEAKAPETPEPPTPPEAKAPETPEPPAAAPPETPPPTEAELATQRIAELEAELAVARKPAAAAPPEPEGKPAAEAVPAAPSEIQWYQPSEAEAAVLAEHAKEWPEINKAEEIRTKAAVFNAVQYVFSEIAAKYGPVLDRFKLTADAIEETLALQEIRSSHDDYDSVRDKVVSWVDTLPVAFKAGAQEIMKRGTPEEVSSLIAEFKKQTAPSAAPGTPAAKDKTELSVAAKKAVGNLSVVDSKRTSVPAAAPDKNDFEGAWNEASAAG